MSEPVSIDASTRYCAIFGLPVRHSASPAMHNAALAELALNWRYLAFEVPIDQLRAAIEGARAMRFMGLNLTVPHKVAALTMMDSLDASANTWGAVNTVRFEGRTPSGAWTPLAELGAEIPTAIRACGYNTDADALIRSLREELRFEPAGATILVLGAGGAGRVAALRLAIEKPGALFLVNRTRSKAEAVASEIRRLVPETRVTTGYPERQVDLLVNATSLGLKESDAMPVDRERFPLARAGAVYDLIYRPAETPLLRAAREAGCRTANGLGMLLYQGAAALELWTGRPAPVETMRLALRRSIYGS